MPKVLMAPMTLKTVEGPYRQVLRDAGFELVFPNGNQQLVEDELLAALAGCDASLAGSEPYNARVLAAHPQLRVIARVGVGYDAVDVAAATAHGSPSAPRPAPIRTPSPSTPSPCFSAWRRTSYRSTLASSPAPGRARPRCRCAAARSASPAWAASARPSPSAARPSA